MNPMYLLSESSSTQQSTGLIQQFISLSTVCGATVGAVVGWILNGLKTRAQIDKLKKEAVTEAGKTLEKIQSHRKSHTDGCKECTACINALIALLKSGNATQAAIVEAREKLCAAIGETVIPRFHDLAEWEHLSKKSDPVLLKNFIESQLLPELRRYGDWIYIINGEKFTKGYGLTAYAVSVQTAQPFLDVLAGLSASHTATLEPLVAAEIARMRNA